MTAKPRILIDARMVSPFEHGISRYVSSIAESLLSLGLPDLEYEPVFILSEEVAGLSLPLWSQFQIVTARSSFLSPKEIFEIPKIIRKIGAVAFHSPSFASFPGITVPTMQTVHDLIHLHYGNIFQKIYYCLLLRPSARRAKILATVSNSAAQDLSTWIPRNIDDIRIHLNTFTPFRNDRPVLESENKILSGSGLSPGTYYLAIANEKRHKNLAMLRDAHSRSGSPWPLIIAHEFLNKFDPQRREEFAITALIRNARAVLAPSLSEGFGRVPVEAVLLGAPIVISDIPSHREIFLRDNCAGVSFLDPTDVELWQAKIRQFDVTDAVVPDEGLRKELLHRFALGQLAPAIDLAYRDLILIKH